MVPFLRALHVTLPKVCGQIDKQVSIDFVTACINALDCASSNHFGSLSFPALGMDGVHNVSATVCANTLLQCIEKYCLEKHTTLHMIRIVITQDLSSALLSSLVPRPIPSFSMLHAEKRVTLKSWEWAWG